MGNMMKPEQISYRPIGIIHSPYKKLSGMPIQPTSAEDVEGTVILDPAYQNGLQDLDGFSHIYLFYHFHKAGKVKLKVKPFLDDQERGVFATRAPHRPNGIGMSVVKLLNIDGNRLQIKNIDVLDGTPLLDIKPYVPGFDQPEITRVGWLETKRGDIKGKLADDRFIT
jgi:tRNA-Thr(GGU) m(6)t(6)A37 methyltransferase TsaA